jgi:hypothetical protein
MSLKTSRVVGKIITRALEAAAKVPHFLMTADQHRRRARQLRSWKRGSRAAKLHEISAQMIDRRLEEAANWRVDEPLG